MFDVVFIEYDLHPEAFNISFDRFAWCLQRTGAGVLDTPETTHGLQLHAPYVP